MIRRACKLYARVQAIPGGIDDAGSLAACVWQELALAEMSPSHYEKGANLRTVVQEHFFSCVSSALTETMRRNTKHMLVRRIYYR